MATAVTLLIENLKTKLIKGEITPRDIPNILYREWIDISEFKRFLYMNRIFEQNIISRKQQEMSVTDDDTSSVTILNESFELQELK